MHDHDDIQSIDSSVLQGKACRMLQMRNQQQIDVQSGHSELHNSKATHTQNVANEKSTAEWEIGASR